ncbi:MAG: twin-arginine translocase subunit TatC [Armatimonadetes bacterium]|nr:twin-arginine translocase subunit TatC [Armatimonadota bacterium]
MSDSAIAELEDDDAPGRQLELLEHLTELRTRIIRVVVYVAVGMLFGWIFYSRFFSFLTAPVSVFLKGDSSFLITGITEAFSIKMQISVVIGIVLALPLITMEGWRFVAPGLTRRERRSVKLVAPLSVVLSALGLVTAYFVMPMGIRWLIGLIPKEAKFMPNVQTSMLFIVKTYLAFAVLFQMPVVLMFLGKVGIVTSDMLTRNWRQAIVVIGIVAAAATPSGDAVTMMMMCGPMIVLYILSIGLVRMVEHRA